MRASRQARDPNRVLTLAPNLCRVLIARDTNSVAKMPRAVPRKNIWSAYRKAAPFYGTLRIKLPQFENPPKGHPRGKPQPKFKFDRTKDEIEQRFCGYDFHSQPFQGNCCNDAGEWERDENVLIEIETSFDENCLSWLGQFQRKLERRFKQREVYMRIAPLLPIDFQ